MRRLGIFVCAFYMAVTAAALAPEIAIAQSAKQVTPDSAAYTPLIGYPLSQAVKARLAGNCHWRGRMLQQARDDLAFSRGYFAAHPNGRIKKRDIDEATKNLAIETAKPCKPNKTDRQRYFQRAALPKLTGTVQPMPSSLKSGATPGDRANEAIKKMRELDADKTKCDVMAYRRWLEVIRKILGEVKLRRDAALVSVGNSAGDAQDYQVAYRTARFLWLDFAEEHFDLYRIRCAGKPDKPGTQPPPPPSKPPTGKAPDAKSPQAQPEGKGSKAGGSDVKPIKPAEKPKPKGKGDKAAAEEAKPADKTAGDNSDCDFIPTLQFDNGVTLPGSGGAGNAAPTPRGPGVVANDRDTDLTNVPPPCKSGGEVESLYRDGAKPTGKTVGGQLAPKPKPQGSTSGPAPKPRSQDTSIEDPEWAAVEGTPLIKETLRLALILRRAHDCTKRERFLNEAREDLAFYRRYLARNPDGEIKQEDIDKAQQSLDREKAKPCVPGDEEKERLAALAKLPRIIGTVAPMRSKLPPNATIKQREDEIEKAIKKVDDVAYPGPADDEVCDPHLYRRWLKNAQDLRQELKLRRDAALAAGGKLSKIDPLKAQKDYAGARLVADSAELGFDQFRVQCARLDKEEEAIRKRQEKDEQKQSEEWMRQHDKAEEELLRQEEEETSPPRKPPVPKVPYPERSNKAGKSKPDDGCSYVPGSEDCGVSNPQDTQLCEAYGTCDDKSQSLLCEAYGTCDDKPRQEDCSELDGLLGTCSEDRRDEPCPEEGGDCGNSFDVPRELDGFIPDPGAIPGGGGF